MRQTIHRTMLAALIGLAAITGCAGKDASEMGFTYKDLPVATGSAKAGDGNSVTFKGAPLPLAGPEIKVGDALRDVLDPRLKQL